MKETPIIMSGNHPKLVLDGIKTVTRRTAGLNELNKEPARWEYMRTNNDGNFLFWVLGNDPELDEEKRYRLVKCPYGQVGDRLWVREAHTWVTLGEKDPWKDRAIADGSFRRDKNGEPVTMIYKADGVEIPASWTPSIHMFRWASRITLEITEVRVERVQEITEEDCKKEGIEEDRNGIDIEPSILFHMLWDSLNAKRGYGWAVNPWVWVISFRRLDG